MDADVPQWPDFLRLILENLRDKKTSFGWFFYHEDIYLEDTSTKPSVKTNGFMLCANLGANFCPTVTG
jgi:hypothetical protein